MLSRSGQTMLEGLPKRAKEPGLPLHTASNLQVQLRRPQSRENQAAYGTQVWFSIFVICFLYFSAKSI